MGHSRGKLRSSCGLRKYMKLKLGFANWDTSSPGFKIYSAPIFHEFIAMIFGKNMYYITQ
jgi:hypothetical protein